MDFNKHLFALASSYLAIPLVCALVSIPFTLGFSLIFVFQFYLGTWWVFIVLALIVLTVQDTVEEKPLISSICLAVIGILLVMAGYSENLSHFLNSSAINSSDPESSFFEKKLEPLWKFIKIPVTGIFFSLAGYYIILTHMLRKTISKSGVSDLGDLNKNIS